MAQGITYSSAYDSVDVRGVEDRRAWDIQQVLKHFWRPNTRVLDVGCGSCAKTSWMASESIEFVAMDPSPLMREAAAQRLAFASDKIRVIEGIADDIPLESASMSHLVSLLAPHNIHEFARVLERGSYCVFETLGELDKRTLKDAFPPDENGLRGQISDLAYRQRADAIRKDFEDNFRIVLFSEGQWNSFYNRHQLEALLENTNVIRNFSFEEDREILDNFENLNSNNGSMTLLNHRYLVVGQRL